MFWKVVCGCLGEYIQSTLLSLGAFLALVFTACLAEAEAASLDNHGKKHLELLPREEAPFLLELAQGRRKPFLLTVMGRLLGQHHS